MWMARSVFLITSTINRDADQRTAVAFGYLERLLHLGDTSKFLEEETRLRSLSNVLNAAGFEAYLYEDFAEELFELMRELGAALGKGDGDALLHEKFNDESIQNCVITHMKVTLMTCRREILSLTART